jgi:hypothetical protein
VVPDQEVDHMSETEPERPAPDAEPEESPAEVIFGPDTAEDDDADAGAAS